MGGWGQVDPQPGSRAWESRIWKHCSCACRDTPTQPQQQSYVLQHTVFPASLIHAPSTPATARGKAAQGSWGKQGGQNCGVACDACTSQTEPAISGESRTTEQRLAGPTCSHTQSRQCSPRLTEMMYEEQVPSLTAGIAGHGKESQHHAHARQYSRASHHGHTLRHSVTTARPVCITTPCPLTKGVYHDAQDEKGDAQATQADLRQWTHGN